MSMAFRKATKRKPRTSCDFRSGPDQGRHTAPYLQQQYQEDRCHRHGTWIGKQVPMSLTSMFSN